MQAGPAPGAATNPATRPLAFEPNIGQTDAQANFLAHGPGYTAFLTPTGAVFALTQPTTHSQTPGKIPDFGAQGQAEAIGLQLVGSDPSATASGADLLGSKTNYFLGNDAAQWHADVPNYATVVYHGVYPGTDLTYHAAAGSSRQLEYDFTVAPGADPSAIRLQVRGAQGVSLDGDGNLVVSGLSGNLVQHAPVAYQAGPTGREAVAARFTLLPDGQIGFSLGAYDPTRPLVIDPVMGYSTYLGGSGDDTATAIATDSTGNAYVSGYTPSTNFPATTGALQTSLSGPQDAFVAKFDPSGALVYATYLGGGDNDLASGVAVDASGNAYLTGTTWSTNFPVTTGAYHTTNGGGTDAFVVKLNASGSALSYSTYLGGTGFENGEGIALDSSGNAYVAGSTGSTNFPATTGAYQTTYGGGGTGGASDAFVAKINASGTALSWATYLGGSNGDYAYAVAVDSSGSAYVAGETTSTNFPTASAAQSTYGGSTDAFVARLNSSGSALSFSTYLGGAAEDWIYGLALDGSGNAYVVGHTDSSNFPATAGAYQTSLHGTRDTLVAKYSPSGALSYATYLGGSASDQAFAVAVTPGGEAVVVGNTTSTDFPTVGAAQTALAGGQDGFVARLDASGATLRYASYWGGTANDSLAGVSLDGLQKAYVAGWTGSNTDFPVSASSYQATFGGGTMDAVVTQLAISPSPPAFATSLDTPGATSAASVRYADGAVFAVAPDLSSGGFGTPWGQTRVWTNAPGYSAGGANGNGWADRELPFLLATSGTNTISVVDGASARYFDLVGGSYQERFFFLDKLTYNSTTGDFVLTDPSGAQSEFYGFADTLPALKRGQLRSYTDPYGNVTTVTAYTAGGLPGEVQRSNTTGSTTVTESYLYTYLTTAVNAGLIANVTLRRQTNGGAWSTIRQVAYSYYGTGDANGNPGDLKKAVIQDGSGNALATYYYRYYLPGAANGYGGGLKYVFGPDSFDRLSNAYANPETATDGQVAPYADEFLQYDSQHRVTQAVAQGAGSSTASAVGLGTFTYSYTSSNNAPGFNAWAVKTVETLPDLNTNTVYTNAYGEVMLSAFHDAGTGLTWDGFTKYDSAGRVLLTAAPSAVTGYSDSYADLLDSVSGNYQYLSDSTGLITTYDYYASTTATGTTAGGVAGYQQDTKIQQGETGTSVLQETWQYFARSASGTTVAPVASDTVYRNTDGTGSQATAYAYTWVGSTAGTQSVTVTMPTVTTAENGPNTADTTTTFFDTYGNPVWAKDGNGYLNYTAFDPVTGAVLKTITDVNTTLTGDFTGLPSGWSTPSGGGLHLIDQYQVDGLGRTTKYTEPNGNITYTVYLDPSFQTRTYAGWNSSTNTATGPTAVTRYDPAGSYTESLTMSATPHVTGGAPDGTEAIGGVQTLARSYSNAAGQVVYSDDYFNLSGLTYSTAVSLGTLNTNYYRTSYGYDVDGRQARVQAPTGTISRSVYDGAGRLSSLWVGTNDTPSSGSWSPTNNTGSANMVPTEADQYDNGGVGDGNLTEALAYPDAVTAPRLTANDYDWRDRLVVTQTGVASEGLQLTGGTERVSTDSTGAQANGASDWPSVSGDGRYVAFQSDATNLVAGDTNAATDVFVYDRQTGQTTRVSVSSSGAQGNGASYHPSISADGRYVAFESDATNLVSGDTNAARDVFVYDRQTGQTTRVSVSSSGTQGNGNSLNAAISADGRYVSYQSDASNLVSGDTNSVTDVFVYDRQTGQTTRVNVSSAGDQVYGTSSNPSISADGRYVAFQSAASTLVSGDTNSDWDIFVHDNQTGQTTLVSLSSAGVQASVACFGPSISGDGRYVAFQTAASNLVSGDTNGVTDVFVRDLQAGVTTRVSVSTAGAQGDGTSQSGVLSQDGRYVAFYSCATTLVSGDTNYDWDIFVHDLQTGVTTRLSVSGAGTQANNNSWNAAISGDGHYVAYYSSASNLVSGDSNAVADVFATANALYVPPAEAHAPLSYYTYDNLDEVTRTQQYDGDGVTITSSGGVPQPPSSTLLRAQADTLYDEQGRAYRSEVYDVDPSTGSVAANVLTTDTWYDHNGQVLKTAAPGGLVQKQQYDGAGRVTVSYTTDGGGDSGWADAGTVTGDNVLEQVETQYDADGNPTLTTTRQRFHDQTATGALGSASTGTLARVSYQASYYDSANRLTADVDFGTYGGNSFSRPGSVPAASDTVLVTSYSYNAAGLLDTTTDPRGIASRTFYDGLGRVTKTVQDYTDGTPTASSNKTTEYTYDGDNNVLTVQADEPGGASEQTQYVYGATMAGGNASSSNDVLVAVRYPDKTTGAASSSSQETYTTNALGQVTTYTDRNGTTHTYTYDVLGRQVSDAVTTLGSGVDGSVRRIETAYDTQGNPYLFTSYDAAVGGNVVNQVQQTYNGLGQITAEYQSHAGAVNISTTPRVQYAYTEMAGGVNNSRLTSMTYPNGRVLNYNYATGLDNTISRLTSILDSSGTLESYSYLGLATVVKRAHPLSGVDLTYIKQTGESNGDAGDQYTGLDRFGRVVDQRWLNASTGVATDRFQYGYDRDSNVLYKNNLVNSSLSELYHANGATGGYDNLNQLTAFARGTLSDTNSDGVPDTVSTPSSSQSWTLDALGNMPSITTNGTPQTQTYNQQNELTASGSATLTYDGNGNTTTDQTGNTLTYDAWNRLTQVKNSSNAVIAGYSYDALGRRLVESEGGTSTDLYYSAQGQVLEERVSGTTKVQYVWSAVDSQALVERDRDADGNAGNGLEERLWVQQDANYNVTALLNSSGSVVERYLYSPYGQVLVRDASWNALAGSAYAWRYLFQGGRYDGATGLYQFGARDYSPTLSRWLQTDPIGFAGGDTNLYRSEGDNPATLTDPSGLQAGPRTALQDFLWYVASDGQPVTLTAAQQSLLQQFRGWDNVSNILRRGVIQPAEAMRLLDHPLISGVLRNEIPPERLRLGGCTACHAAHGFGRGEPVSWFNPATATIRPECYDQLRNAIALTSVLDRLVIRNAPVIGTVVTIRDAANGRADWADVLQALCRDTTVAAGTIPGGGQSGGPATSPSLPALPQGYHYRNVGGRIDVVRNPGRAADLPPLHLENGRLVLGHTPSVVRDNAARAAFLRGLANDPNVPRTIRPWLQRGEVPPGFQVHHRRALFDSGTDSIDNMVLQGTDIHTIIHRYYRPGGQVPSINPRAGTGNPY